MLPLRKTNGSKYGNEYGAGCFVAFIVAGAITSSVIVPITVIDVRNMHVLALGSIASCCSRWPWWNGSLYAESLMTRQLSPRTRVARGTRTGPLEGAPLHGKPIISVPMCIAMALLCISATSLRRSVDSPAWPLLSGTHNLSRPPKSR